MVQTIIFVGIGGAGWVSGTDHLAVQVDVWAELAIVLVFVAQDFALLKLSCKILLLPLFEVFERPLIEFMLIFHLSADVPNVWLECARFIVVEG